MSKIIYEYKDKPYSILYHSFIKVDGTWEPVIVYQCEYENPDGQVWVREQDEFFNLFIQKNE